MRFDPHDLIYRLRHTLFLSFFFAGEVGATIFFRVGGHVDSENAELAGIPNAVGVMTLSKKGNALILSRFLHLIIRCDHSVLHLIWNSAPNDLLLSLIHI